MWINFSAASASIFLPQIIDIHVHNVGQRISGKLPNGTHDGRAGNKGSGVQHQVFEQGKFLGSELDRAASAMDAARDAVELQILHAKVGVQGTIAAAQ